MDNKYILKFSDILSRILNQDSGELENKLEDIVDNRLSKSEKDVKSQVKFKKEFIEKYKPKSQPNIRQRRESVVENLEEEPFLRTSRPTFNIPRPLAPAALQIPRSATHITLFTSENILSSLNDEYQSIKHLIFKLKIHEMMDARLLQKKLKQLENDGKVLVDIQGGKKFWKLKPS